MTTGRYGVQGDNEYVHDGSGLVRLRCTRCYTSQGNQAVNSANGRLQHTQYNTRSAAILRYSKRTTNAPPTQRSYVLVLVAVMSCTPASTRHTQPVQQLLDHRPPALCSFQPPNCMTCPARDQVYAPNYLLQGCLQQHLHRWQHHTQAKRKGGAPKQPHVGWSKPHTAHVYQRQSRWVLPPGPATSAQTDRPSPLV